MIEVNLLPDEMKKKASPFAGLDLSSFNLEKIPVVPVVAGFVGILVAVELLIAGLGIYYGMRLSSLRKRYESVVPEKREADALRARSDAISKKVSAIDELTGKRYSWAKKLNALSDAMTPGIWLSELDYAEGQVHEAQGAKQKGSGMPGALIINGYASGAGEQGAALVGKFIKSLKDNEQFYADFGDITLVSVKSDKVENQEVMSFKINCIFR